MDKSEIRRESQIIEERNLYKRILGKMCGPKQENYK